MTKVIQQMDMTKAAKLFFTNYFDFSGRASRGEFWWAYLAFFIVSTILFVVDGVIVGMIFGFTDNELLSITENEFLSNNGFFSNIFSLVTLIGWISLSFLGKKFFEIFNNILKKIPILRTIYSAIGQMTESLTKTDNKQKSVVLLEYPRKGVWAVGFATKANEGLIKKKVNEDLINVFVPTTPNPTSGFLLMVPKKDLIYLEVSFEQASKFIVSAGTTNIN